MKNYISELQFFKNFFTILLLFFAACNFADDLVAPIISNSPVIMPLKVGNKWVYEQKLFNPDATVIDNFQHIVEVNKEITLAGTLWYVVNDVYVARNSPEGLWIGEYMADEIDYIALSSKYPGVLGEKWENNTRCVVSTDTLIKVPAGEFHCLKYQIEIQNLDKQYFYYKSPNVGLIRAEEYRIINDGNSFLQEVTELESLYLKQ